MKKAAEIAAYWQGAASSKGDKQAQCHWSRPTLGRDLKTLFTIRAWERYGAAMLVFAALALAAAPLAPIAVAPARQARAMVRIISSAKLRFAELEERDPNLFRQSSVNLPDGSTETARLIEFQ